MSHLMVELTYDRVTGRYNEPLSRLAAVKYD